MKRFIALLMMASTALLLSAALSSADQECGMGGSTENPNPTIRFGGRHISSTGTLRVLMIWVRFLDDNETTSIWPDPLVLPEWAKKFIDTAYSGSGNYYSGTVSHYFYQNSYGKMHVVGKVYYVTTNYAESYYHQIAGASGSSAARSAIEIEVLGKLDAAPYNVDFTLYDTWKYRVGNQDFQHQPGVDNNVDMIWFMTRNLRDAEFDAPQRFAIGQAKLDCPTHTRDGKTILGSGFPGSGIGMFVDHLHRPVNSSTGTNGMYPIVNHVAHEMSHYFFGEGHFANPWGGIGLATRRDVSNLYEYSGGWAGDYCGYKKWRLTWLQPTTVSANTDSTLLCDLATTTDSTKNRLLKIPIPGTSQFFLIENRRWISIFEARLARHNDVRGVLKPGLLVYHVVEESDAFMSTKLQKLDADGRFTWKIVYWGPNTTTGTDDVIEKGLADRSNGYSETERIWIPGITDEKWASTCNPDGTNPYGGGPYQKATYFLNTSSTASDWEGDSLDLCQVGDVVTPWSNPASHRWDATNETFVSTTIGFEVKGFNPSTQTYALAIRLSDPQWLSPLKPQNLRVTDSGPPPDGHHPKLTWSRNQEPDLAAAPYKIWRKITGLESYDWTIIGTVSDTSYVDRYIALSGDELYTVYYKVKCVDNTGKQSAFSDDVSIGAHGLLWKTDRSAGSSDKAPPEYNLGQNYPNPFNPKTSIDFHIPQASHVSLKLYELLGREVATLVDGKVPAGSHRIELDASVLSSGVYFYRIQAGSFVSARKLIVTK